MSSYDFLVFCSWLLIVGVSLPGWAWHRTSDIQANPQVRFPSCSGFAGLDWSNEEHVVVQVSEDALLTKDIPGFQLKSFYFLSI